jgi:hypothetical protein
LTAPRSLAPIWTRDEAGEDLAPLACVGLLEGSAMSKETEAVTSAAAALTHAMSGLIKAIDAVGDDGEAAKHLPDGLAAELERLVARISADSGLAG